jgi:subtilase family serine protease
MELFGNWGSKGQIYVNGVFTGQTFGRSPSNDGTPDTQYRQRHYPIDARVKTLEIRVYDITTASEIFIDDVVMYVADSLSVVSDLEPTLLTVPATGQIGAPVTVSWSTRNNGFGDAPGGWNAAFYVSSDDVYGNDTLVLSVTENNVIGPGATLPATDDITFAGMPPGDYWVFYHADDSNVVPELNENNNVIRGGPIHLAPPPHPDLQVTSVEASDSTIVGQGVLVEWSVENVGDSVATGTWKDQVQIFPAGQQVYTPLQDFDYSFPLDTNSTYLRRQGITLPDTLTPGYYRLVVWTNAYGLLNEYGDITNNALPQSDSILVKAAPLPDLAVDSLAHSDTAVPCGTIEVSWRVKNNGDAQTNTPNWFDYIWLAPVDNPQNYLQGKLLASFVNLSYLPVGGGYLQQSRQVQLPSTVGSGQYVIVVATDGGGNVAEHDNTNNAFIGETLTVQPGECNRPDLFAEVLIAPSTVWAGNPDSVVWKVSNLGNADATPLKPNDWVLLSPDSIIDPDGDIPINGDFQGQTIAAATASDTTSYEQRRQVMWPNSLAAGDYLLYVWTDVDLFYDDSNLDNNISAPRPVTVNTPAGSDLKMVDVQVTPSSVLSGASVLVEWTVENIGGGPGTVSAWFDGIYLSEDDTLDTNIDPRLTKPLHSGFVQPGGTYTGSTTMNIPGGAAAGTYHIFACADVQNQVTEEGPDPENNNCRKWLGTLTVTDPPASDLVVTIDNIEQPAFSGQFIEVSWTVSNISSEPTTASNWLDYIYLSSDSVFSTATFVKSVSHVGALGVGAEYSPTVSINLPNGASGDYFIFVVADANNHVLETNEPNRDGMRFHIDLTPPPDLRVTQVIGPTDTITAGTGAVIQWTVANLDTGVTIGNTWTDRVYLSGDATLDGADDVLANYTHIGALALNEFYQDNRTIGIPSKPTGDYFIIVETDANNTVYEHTTANEINNTRSFPIIIELPVTPLAPKPDLAFTELSFTDDLKDTLHYRVVNLGPGNIPAGQRQWVDRFYLSYDAVLDGSDDLFASFSRVGDLMPGEGYTRDKQVTLPDGTQGPHYIIGRTDATIIVDETNEQNDSSIATSTTLTPPDLTVALLASPVSALSGQPTTIVWETTNGGTGPTGGAQWYDGVYLSLDQVLDSNDDLLGSKHHTGVLDTVDTYIDSLAVTIPLGLSGPMYVFVETDKNDAIYEHNQEDNNFNLNPPRVDILLPEEADLTVVGVTAPDTTASGELVEFNWMVSNNSAVNVIGQWTDAVYVSVDNRWDINDLFVGNKTQTGGLAAGALVAQRFAIARADLDALLETEMPGLFPDDYHVVVRADVFNNINETSEENNEQSSTATMNVDVTELTLGDSTLTTIAFMEQQYFRLNVPVDTDVRFVFWGAQLGDDELEMYVSWGELPTRILHEYTQPVVPDEEVVVPRTSSGDLYLMIYGAYLTSDRDYNILADGLPFGISRVAPNRVGNAGFATLAITGGQLSNVTTVQLRSETGVLVTASPVDTVNSTSVNARFDLRGKDSGFYDLIIETVAAARDSIEDGVYITSGIGPVIFPAIRGPDAIRQATTFDYEVSLRNVGDADAYDAMTGVTLNTGAEYRLILEGAVGPRVISNGEEFIVHTDFIGIGARERFSIRVYGEATLTIDVVAVHSAPLYFDLAAGSRIVSEWITEATQAFVDTLADQAVTVDSIALDTLVVAAWTDAGTRSGAPVSTGLATQIEDKFLLALGDLGDPNVPPIPTGITGTGIGAAIDGATGHYKKQKKNPKFKKTNRQVRVRVARDPNGKEGKSDAGEDNFVTQIEDIPYTIHFENVPTAEATAQQVVITDQLDPDLDPRRFRVGEIAFGDEVIAVPANRSFFQTTLTLPSGDLLEIDAGVNVISGEARWTFRTIDPATGYPPLDPDRGFLPPNADSTGVGQGHVFFTVRADENAADGTEIVNSAEIVFDTNDPLITNEVLNIVRRVLPDLEVTSSSVSSSSLIEGAPLSISSTVGNVGEAPATPFNVGFFLGDPDAGGQQIAPPQSVSPLAAGDERLVDGQWTPHRLVGQHDVFIRADEGNNVSEDSEGNNDRILTLTIAPRDFTLSLVSGVNLISLPLETAPPMSAQSFATMLGATMVIRYDTTGTDTVAIFETFVDGQGGDGFAIQAGHGYIVDVTNAQSVRFEGITHLKDTEYEMGLNSIALPVKPAAPFNARTLSNFIGANMLVRFNESAGVFEPFIRDFHDGNGFVIRGGEGYLAFMPTAPAGPVSFAGEGWLGDQTPQSAWSSITIPGERNWTPVFAFVGDFVQDQWGEIMPASGDFRAVATHLPSGRAIHLRDRHQAGTFNGALLDFSGSNPVRLGDRFDITVVNDVGEPVREAIEYTVTEEDLKRRRASLTLTVTATPRVTTLYQNFPNPFNPVTTVRYEIAEAGDVTLNIYNVRGQLIKTLVNESRRPGFYEVQWRGNNNRGESVASGVYFYKLTAPGFNRSKKMVFLK